MRASARRMHVAIAAIATAGACAQPPASPALARPTASPASTIATATRPPEAMPAAPDAGLPASPPPVPRANAADAARLVLFARNDRHGFRDARGAVVLPPTFLAAYPFDAHGVARVLDDTGWRCIDARGRTLVRPYVFDNGPDYASEGLARFVSGGKVGYADEACAVVIPAAYDFGAPFEGGLAAVCIGCRAVADGEHTRMEGGAWGFIDARGDVAVPLRFDAVESFVDGHADVVLGGKRQVIDRRGLVVR